MATLNQILGTLPSGRMSPISDDLLTRYLAENYRTDADKKRRQEAAKRLDLYRDRGRRHFQDAIARVFINPRVREWREIFLEFAEFQNVTKRIVREISTVYAEPAIRYVKGDNEGYQLLLAETRYDRVLRNVNRLGNLLNDVLVWPSVVERNGRKVAVVRVITTDKFTPIAHPEDPLYPVGFIIDQFPRGVLRRPTDPHYLILTEEEFIWLDEDWRFVRRAPHNVGRMPALLFSRELREDAILDGTSGADVISAHMAVALLNTMMLRHQKSGTKMAYATGDTSGMARGQPMDDESILEAPEGVTFNTLDLGADPSSYIDTVRAVIKQIAANYGIPESVFDLSYQATSGYEISLKRTGLKEVRRDQVLDFRPFERELAELMSVVLSRAGHPLAYSTEGWGISFGDMDAPDSPLDKLTYWEKLEQLGLANRVEMYMEMNPEVGEAEAIKAVERNLQMRIEQMAKFQGANPGTFGPKGSDNQPEDDAPDEPLDEKKADALEAAA